MKIFSRSREPKLSVPRLSFLLPPSVSTSSTARIRETAKFSLTQLRRTGKVRAPMLRRRAGETSGSEEETEISDSYGWQPFVVDGHFAGSEISRSVTIIGWARALAEYTLSGCKIISRDSDSHSLARPSFLAITHCVRYVYVNVYVVAIYACKIRVTRSPASRFSLSSSSFSRTGTLA